MHNFLSLYNRYSRNTEPPKNFHAWSAISAISALLGRKCFINQDTFLVFPNLYVVLVGEPGLRKDTAIRVARELVRESKVVPVASKSVTREALIDEMSSENSRIRYTLAGKHFEYSQQAAFLGELKEFIGGKHINDRAISFLTAIYDEVVYDEATRSGKKKTITHPYFSFLGGCTPSWVSTSLKSDMITDGFSRRCIFVLEDEIYKRVPWMELSKDERSAWPLLIEEVNRIAKIKGAFALTPEARKIWDTFYESIHTNSAGKDQKIKNYLSSKHVLVHKVCMCLSAALRSDRIIDSAILNLGIKFLDETEKNLPRVLSGVGRNELKAFGERILTRIISSGREGITRKQLQSEFWENLRTFELEEVLAALLEQGSVTVVDHVNVGQTVYRPEKDVKLLTQANLLALACRIKLSCEKLSADFLLDVLPHRFDQESEIPSVHQQLE